MLHSAIGQIGHLLIISAFVSALVGAFAYYRSSANEMEEQKWKSFARYLFFFHALCIFGIVATLFTIIYKHYFEYYYAWSHSSRSLPIHYMISCFWEGQEGSFLLWLFWHACLGIILIFFSKKWESSVMTIFLLVQAFLSSMILGVVFGNIKIGSSPFILLRDAMGDIPVFQSNPNFVPMDGKGLNPLLQNYWMVIHPPTLFLGFALTLIPFAFCIAGLWKGSLKEWVRMALPWNLVAGLILGIGILMGSYWAYETLNFGGYWNWDPVENSVYIPWVVLIASIHAMLIFNKNGTALKYTIVLVVLTFLLVLYSTFLTRSGILGESSVHSFTDLGLSGQLMIYLFFFVALSLFLIARSWKKIPNSSSSTSVYTADFWVLAGATILCLGAFQVILPTSIPVYNALFRFLGGTSKLAPPVDAISFYSRYQTLVAALITLFSATAQFFWWKKIDKKTAWNIFYIPVIITLIASTVCILVTQITNGMYIFLITCCIYSIVSNAKLMWDVLKLNPRVSGGALAHIGIALMIIGILFSSGYSKVLSQNRSGMMYSSELSEEINRDNLLLFIHTPVAMENYTLTYKGQYVRIKTVPSYVSRSSLWIIPGSNQALVKKDIQVNKKIYYKQGDRVEFKSENVYYQVEYRKNNGKVFTLFPRAQINPSMGLIASPDIQKFLAKDLYTHVSAVIPPDEERKWNTSKQFSLMKDSVFKLDPYTIKLKAVERLFSVPGVQLNDGDVAIKVVLETVFMPTGFVEEIDCFFAIRNNTPESLPEISSDLGLRIQLLTINPKNGLFTFDGRIGQRDYVILKVVEKPLINILWLGTILMSIGFVIAIRRRYIDLKKNSG